MAGTMARETKREGQRKAKRCMGTKKRIKLIPLVVGSYFTQGPFNVTYMQIVRSNSNGRSKTSITRQCNLPFYSKG